VRDRVVDFLNHYHRFTGLAVVRLLFWLGLSPRKFQRWKDRYGKANEHNAMIPRDHWIEPAERAAIIQFARQYPLEGYRRLTFMMLDRDIAAVSPATTYRVLKAAGLIGSRFLAPSRKGQGFVQPLQPHEHWHVDFSHVNLGIAKMAEACPGTTARKLDWLASLHVRDETYAKALAELVNHHHRHAFAEHWGEGKTSSSDGQRFRAGGRGEAAGQVNLRYGNEPGVLFYTHISDRYTPFYSTVIAANARDATYVLDGLLYHESDLRIEETLH
jgi:Tn3 transposase DDE domain